MKLFYKQSFGAALLALMIAGTACGQKTKTTIKTITIIDGDTTVNEEVISDKDFSWSDDSNKKKKNVKVMKIVTSNDDSSNADAEMKVFMDEDGDDDGKKTFTKKIIIMDDGGNVKTIENENGYSYEIEIDENGKKEKRVFKSNESDEGKGKKSKYHEIKKTGTFWDENSLGLKTIKIHKNIEALNINIELESISSEPINVIVMDENGKQVFYDSQKGDKYKKEIKLGKKGVYFLSIIQNKKVLNERIVVE